MPRRNRVTPAGEFEAVADRGLLMGNRGILHDGVGVLGKARWKHPHWVCCVTSFKGRKRELMAPGRYTELFFLDEAVALAAGHRPCAECRRADNAPFVAAWRRAFAVPANEKLALTDIDRVLHAARIGPGRTQQRHTARLADLPDGAMILMPGTDMPALMWKGVRPWSHGGYGAVVEIRRDADVTVLTPKPTVRVLAAGYLPVVHPSAA